MFVLKHTFYYLISTTEMIKSALFLKSTLWELTMKFLYTRVSLAVQNVAAIAEGHDIK